MAVFDFQYCTQVSTCRVKFAKWDGSVNGTKRTGHHVVGEEKTSVTMFLNKILWLEINANTSSNERMPARHRSLWRDWLCSLQFVSGLYSSHKYPQLNNGYGRFFPTYNMVACSLGGNVRFWGPCGYFFLFLRRSFKMGILIMCFYWKEFQEVFFHEDIVDFFLIFQNFTFSYFSC